VCRAERCKGRTAIYEDLEGRPIVPETDLEGAVTLIDEFWMMGMVWITVDQSPQQHPCRSVLIQISFHCIVLYSQGLVAKLNEQLYTTRPPKSNAGYRGVHVRESSESRPAKGKCYTATSGGKYLGSVPSARLAAIEYDKAALAAG
jgi:hypothetical protein